MPRLTQRSYPKSKIFRRRLRGACRNGEWSFSCRPLLHVHHTWVVERSALLGCEWTILSSRRFASPRDDDVTWTISLEVDNSLGSSGRSTCPTLRAPESVSIEVRPCSASAKSIQLIEKPPANPSTIQFGQ